MQNSRNSTITKPDIISLEQLEREEKPKADPLSPEREDEISVSGHMPDPESDDDTLLNAHQMGLQRGETYDNAVELNLDRDLDTNDSHAKTH